MDARERRAFEAQIMELRSVVNHAPAWHPTSTRDGHPVVVGPDNQVLLSLVGPWSPSLSRWFEVFSQYGLLRVVALLESLSGTSSENEARDLVAKMLAPPRKHSVYPPAPPPEL